MSRPLVLKSRPTKPTLKRDFRISEIVVGQLIEIDTTYFRYKGQGLVTKIRPTSRLTDYTYAEFLADNDSVDKNPHPLHNDEITGIYI